LAISGTLQQLRFRLGLCAAALLCVSACATTKAPIQHPGPVIPEPVPVTLPPPVVQAPPPEPESPEALAPPKPQYTDLLARMRAGFSLETPDVDETRIARELAWFARHPDYIERTFDRAAPYLHYIVSEVEARGLPLELAVLPVIESAFEPYAYSRARAAGLWQFIPGTGTRFGLRQDFWYDGRRDVVSATRAALDYLEFLHETFNGDWLLAIAAYNCGEQSVDRQVKLNQAKGKPIDFWHLKLPKETQAYVPKLLAMARLVARPDNYGLEFSEIPNEPYFQRVETGGQIDVTVAAELAGVSTEDLYALNPAYHRFATAPNGPHFLLVPVESADAFRQNLLQLTPDQRMRVERYAVRRNDTVASIAKQFGTTPNLIRELNGLEASSRIEVDSELRIPSSVTTLPPKVIRAAALVDGKESLRRGRNRHLHVVARGDSLSAIARKTGVPVAKLARLNGMDPDDTLRAGQRLKLPADAGYDEPPAKARKTRGSAAASERGRRVTYTVRAGDTLFSISRLLEVSVQSLRTWNSLGAHASIRTGQKLIAFVRNGS
jgi:membrane-bound lytic murein transglycosylase D